MKAPCEIDGAMRKTGQTQKQCIADLLLGRQLFRYTPSASNSRVLFRSARADNSQDAFFTAIRK
jgi:hypothetical protein